MPIIEGQFFLPTIDCAHLGQKFEAHLMFKGLCFFEYCMKLWIHVVMNCLNCFAAPEHWGPDEAGTAGLPGYAVPGIHGMGSQAISS